MHKARLCCLAALLGAVGCADAERAEDGQQSGEWVVAPEPLISVGGADEREDYQLFRVAGATRLSDGRFVVANGGSSELRYYSPEGQHLLSVGGEGDGPGELRGIMEIEALQGDTLMVLSFRPGLTWFDPDGEFIKSTRVS